MLGPYTLVQLIASKGCSFEPNEPPPGSATGLTPSSYDSYVSVVNKFNALCERMKNNLQKLNRKKG